MVYVDRQPIGRTPVSHSFTYYGTRHFEIVHDGYRTEKFLRTFHPPWYQIPPLDFVFENLWPFEKRDDRVIDVQLVPDEPMALEALVQNGEQLRLQASQGIAVPINRGVSGTESGGSQILPPIMSSPWNAPFEGSIQTVPATPPIQDWPSSSVLEEVLTPRDAFPQSVPSVTPGGSYRPPIGG